MKIDVLAYANGEMNQAHVVEVNSHVREAGIMQPNRPLLSFRKSFPEHRNKPLHGIIAAVDVSMALRERALNEGLYVACIHDEVFALDIPDDFQPRAFDPMR